MTVITKVAAGVLTAGLLFGGSSAAFAVEPVVSGPVVSEPAPVLITEADVAAAHAAFKQAQVDARTAERQTRVAARAAEKVAGDQVKLVKGKAKRGAQAGVKALRAGNHAALKALKAENDVLVDAAKAAYQQVAAAYEAQQATLIEEPVVSGPVEEPATV
ncbi:hypothetical protein [Arthrobacter sp. H14]|uniref:hypothetical protein n=1 Tax=Arthrobacter sp. H14 TaxID=1312959 RepID=UPI00047D8D1D|nr:hypothetical protein [Arthrobacter sp. H14]